jgi:hypothetical protein
LVSLVSLKFSKTRLTASYYSNAENTFMSSSYNRPDCCEYDPKGDLFNRCETDAYNPKPRTTTTASARTLDDKPGGCGQRCVTRPTDEEPNAEEAKGKDSERKNGQWKYKDGISSDDDDSSEYEGGYGWGSSSDEEAYKKPYYNKYRYEPVCN